MCSTISIPSWTWVVTYAINRNIEMLDVSMTSWAWFVTVRGYYCWWCESVSMPSWAWVVTIFNSSNQDYYDVSMPLWAWVVTRGGSMVIVNGHVSMPLWAWVVTARMSNILNFSWYFLCIPAIYRCILAYLPIFFNQLSKFFRCESPSTFLWTCLSHHSFIIFLVTNTNTLLSGLYIIST